MAQAQVVYDNVAETSQVHGSLFDGLKFFVAQRVPSRSTFVNTITSNGGQIVKLEKLADIHIADHLRKDAPPETTSYTWIEESVKNGQVADKENHRAGPTITSSRPVGDPRPGKTARKPYTKADDEFLYRWVTESTQSGQKALGNEIYKQLEQVNANHPWQSWRDRWVKFVQYNKPPDDEARDGSPAAAASGHPASSIPTTTQRARERLAQLEQARVANIEGVETGQQGTTTETTQQNNGSPALPEPDNDARSTDGTMFDSAIQDPITNGSNAGPASISTPRPSAAFTQDERDGLMVLSYDIINLHQDRVSEAWDSYARENPQHTAEEWRIFFDKDIRPVVMRVFSSTRMRDNRSKSSDDGHEEEPERSDQGSPTLRTARAASSQQGRKPATNGLSVTSQDGRHTIKVSPVSGKSNQARGEPVVIIASPTKSAPRDDQRTPSKSKRKFRSPAVDYQPRSTGSKIASNSKRQRLSSRELEVEHVNLEDEMDDQAYVEASNADAMNLLHAQGKFSIWQGEDDVEDNKENVRETDENLAPPTLHGGLDADDVLEAFVPEEVHFRLEPVKDDYRPIDDELSDSDPDDPSVAPSPRISGSGSILLSAPQFREKDVYSVESSDDENSSSRQIHVGPGLTERVAYPPLPQVNSDEDFEDAQEIIDDANTGQQHEEEDEEYQPAFENLTDNLSSRGSPRRRTIRATSVSSSGEDMQSEMMKRQQDTQAIIEAETQGHDLMGMPLPPDDSDDELPQRTLSSPLKQKQSQPKKSPQRLKAPQTRNRMIHPGLSPGLTSSPRPADSDPFRGGLNFGSSPPLAAIDLALPSPERHASPEKGAHASQIQAFITRKVYQGFDEEDVEHILEQTTYDSALTERILASKKAGNGTPKGVPGLWTDQQDDALLGGDAKALKRLEDWHGAEAFWRRMEYLQHRDSDSE